MTSIIEHKGTVESINGSQIKVRILQTSACVSCAAKGFCSSADSKEKIIEVYDTTNLYKPGDPVMIYGTASMGMKAVTIAFIIPFIILLVTLFVAMSFSDGDELLSAFLSLLILIPYYIVLYYMRNKIKKNFSFTLKPIK